MKKCLNILVVFLLCISLVGCKEEEKEYKYTELTQRDDGEPYSRWRNTTTGSAKYLDETSVLVTIYLDDVNSLWLEDDVQLVADNMKVACDYLVEEGKRYGKEVNLIYDTSPDGDLAYRISYGEAFAGSTRVIKDGDDTDKLVYAIDQYIKHNIDSKAILEKYNSNSIGYIIFIDGEADKCTAYSYHTHYKDYYYEEFCLINLRWNYGGNVYPDTYAHEIMHLFGARDLYYTDVYDGASRQFIEHAYEEYPTDIMLGYSADVHSYEDYIEQDITDISAYYLGWMDYIPEIDMFPYIKSEYVASFSESKNTAGGNFMEYRLPSRKITSGKYEESNNIQQNEKISMLILLFIAVVMLIRFIIIEYKSKKMNNPNKIQFK